jgi:hypothetical protein
MTLIKLESGRTILIDINIREPGDDIRDVSKDLRSRLGTDSNGRPFVDAMLVTHPDQDHVRGLEKNFHLGPLSEYAETKKGEDPKIVIREMWSSAMVFRRMPKGETLCGDAKAWQKEARRRVALFRKNGKLVTGDRIQLMGEDADGKTNDLGDILVKTGKTITTINGTTDTSFRGRLLAPTGKGTDEEEETKSKNHSSVIIRFSIAYGDTLHACRFLSGSDAMVAIWERIWQNWKDATASIDYNILQSPHHCSWHSLSHDSWSDKGEDAKVSKDARSALGQAKSGAFIIASSKPIKDDKDDPPCIRAKREYESILSPVKGQFLNTAVHGGKDEPVPMEFDVTASGPVLREVAQKAQKAATLLRAPAAAPAGLTFPPRPVKPVKPAGFA